MSWLKSKRLEAYRYIQIRTRRHKMLIQNFFKYAGKGGRFLKTRKSTIGTMRRSHGNSRTILPTHSLRTYGKQQNSKKKSWNDKQIRHWMEPVNPRPQFLRNSHQDANPIGVLYAASYDPWAI